MPDCYCNRLKKTWFIIRYRVVVLLLLLFNFGAAFSQAPNISYPTPIICKVNTPVAPLVPANTGGAVPAVVYGQVTTFAGSGASGNADGSATTASFNYPAGLTADQSGNIYVADYGNNVIRKISPDGTVSTFAGSGARGTADGTGTNASFYEPNSLVADPSGNVYVVDFGNNLIRKITPSGVVTSVTSGGGPGYTNGPGNIAAFAEPTGITMDASGNIFIADKRNQVIRKITPADTVSTFAGSGIAGYADGVGPSASFFDLQNITTDRSNNLYVTDYYNQRIRKVTPGGTVTTVAGTGSIGAANGPAQTASFNYPSGIVVDPQGNIYIADFENDLLRKITPSGIVSTFAGSGQQAFANGIGTAASFAGLNGLTMDASGNIYIADSYNNVIRKVVTTGYTIDKALPPGLTFDATTGIITGTPTSASPATNYTITAYNGAGSSSFIVNITVTAGATPPVQPPNISYPTPQTYYTNTAIAPLIPANTGGAVPATIYGQVSTFAGGRAPVTYDATGTGAGFNLPSGVTTDAAGNIYVTDFGSGAIRKITPAAVVTTIANVSSPSGIVADSQGNLFVTCFQLNDIYKITANGVASLFAGNGSAGSADGTGNAASFNGPGGITIDGSGNLYVTDQQNNKIRKITPGGVVTTVVGTGAAGAINGAANTASFNNPDGVAVDTFGNIYVADTKNNLIRKITSTGQVTTFAGNGQPGNADGTGTAASFNYPAGLTIDASGNLYVSDYKNNLIRKITPTGTVTTIAGSGTPGNADGIGTAASFNGPLGLATDPFGSLFIADELNYLIRKITLTGYTIDKALPPGLTFDLTTGIITGTPTATSPATNYTITAYNAGGSSSTVINIQVLSAALLPSIITFPPPVINLDANNDFDPGATSTNTETPIMYTSSNPAVAVVTATGLIHVIAPGISIITASQAGDANYNAATPVLETLTVYENQIIVFPPFSTKTTCDTDFSVGAISSNQTIPITYTSSDTSVATISASGIIHIVNNGTTVITASQAGDATLYINPAVPQSETLTVTGPVAPAVTIAADTQSPCAGMAVTFTATTAAGGLVLNYQWQVNGVNEGSNSNTFIASSLNSADIVSCTVTSNGACSVRGTSNTITGIKVNPDITPSVIIQSSATGPVCSGTLINFTAAPTNGGSGPSFQWLVNGINAGANSASFASSALSNGDVVSCVLTNNDSPCLTASTAVSNNIAVSLVPATNLFPVVSISPGSVDTCAGLPLTWSATVTNAGSSTFYQWKVNGVNAGADSSVFISSALNTGDIITCTIISSLTCAIDTAISNQSSVIINQNITNTVNITTTAINNIILPGQQVVFAAHVTDTTGVTYQWQINAVNAGANNPFFKVNNLENGDVVICTITTAGKCVADPFATSNEIKIIVVAPVVIVNTFTPNGDGVNDTWDIPALAAYPNCIVSIFNRWGSLVYNSSGYPTAWDGTYKGKLLPNGTYYYVIDLKNGKGSLSGPLTIIR